MSYSVYIARSEETLYDMALKLYNDARGLSNIIDLNPTLDLNASSYFGQSIIYDPTVVYKRDVTQASLPPPPREKWKVRSFQNAFDLAVQIYGDVTSLDKIIDQLTSLEDPSIGSLLETEFTDNFLANSLFSQKIVSTSEPFKGLTVDLTSITVDSAIITVDKTVYF